MDSLPSHICLKEDLVVINPKIKILKGCLLCDKIYYNGDANRFSNISPCTIRVIFWTITDLFRPDPIKILDSFGLKIFVRSKDNPNSFLVDLGSRGLVDTLYKLNRHAGVAEVEFLNWSRAKPYTGKKNREQKGD